LDPVWAAPAGYLGPWARRSLAESRGGQKKVRAPSFEKQLGSLSIIAGTPEQVIEKLKTLLQETRPSILALWSNDGKVGHADSMSCIKLMGQEVLPRLREIGKSLGLKSPFEMNTPVSLAAT